MDARVWSEEELDAEIPERLYDQPRDLIEIYNDEDEFPQPFRYLTNWSVMDAKGAACALPQDNLETCSATGTLLGATGGTSAPIRIQLNDPAQYIALDRSKQYRGYWIVTSTALYWLHDAVADDTDMIHDRSVLAAVSQLLDFVDLETVSTLEIAKAMKKYPTLQWDLVRAVSGPVARHLVGAGPTLTENCAFLKSMRKGTKKKAALNANLIRWCTLAEQQSQQTAWGHPLGEIEEAASDEEENNDEAASDHTEEEKKEQETAKYSSRPSTSGRRTSAQRTKRKEESADSDSDGEEDQVKRNSTRRPSTNSRHTKRAKRKEECEDSEEATIGSRQVAGRYRRASRGKRVVYADAETDDDDDEDMIEEKKPRARKKTKFKAPSDDESAVAESTDDESGDDLLLDVDSESSAESPASNDEEKKTKVRNTKKAAKGAEAAPPAKKKMCDSFAPMNTPPYMKLSLATIHEEKEFLDPCGMEATDDIIDRLVGDQVDRIGSLLQRSLDNSNIGSIASPLKLGTACSGTDAPALALTLVREQMELRGIGDNFEFTHEFSCENDPFKQAYLARNFDSTLYPDIAKLADDNPRDVYGQEKVIPDFNIFVAGTSCKNFSMLRSTKRLDIEDKGCSGETFLAATEVLFKEKPNFAIFENVIGAPWAKMAEFITGRIKLSECDSSKAVKNIKDAKKDLTFVLEKPKNIVVDQVPGVYGVRCGALVEGFLRPGSETLHNVNWPPGTRKTCSLSDLIKANKSMTKADATLVFQTECTYCTHLAKVDTKEFGLPQTRNRTYMLVWRPDGDKVNDDLGKYWALLVEHLKSPVRHSLQSFILQADHDIIRVFREALKGPPGRQTMRGVALEPYFWESANANLPHNKIAREKLGLEDEARFTTQWHAHGKRQVPPHYWLEYVKCNYQREMDLLDILHGSAMRDAEAHDSSFAAFYWNVSQNASKEKHRSACPGIAGCITPGGDFFLPQEGRPILGCEKLLLQGIPYWRLALGNETEVQLGDLAGNAMSLTVVCATMLAAITCNQLRKDTLQSSHQDTQRILAEASLTTSKKLSQWNAPNTNSDTDRHPDKPSLSVSSYFLELAELAPAAVKSSIWCTCETSGSNSLATLFVACKICRVACCRNCISATAGYNLESHETGEIEISAEDHNMGSFRSKLLSKAANKALIFNKEGIDEIASLCVDDDLRVSGLSNYTFSFHDIKRDRKKWRIIYYARVNAIDEPVAEFQITVGELKKETFANGRKIEIGMKGELKSFLPAKSAPPVYGALDPCATVTVLHGRPEVCWLGKVAVSNSSLVVKGIGAEDSPRVEVGLTDDAARSLVLSSQKNQNKKPFKEARERGEARRWLYPKNWKTWPKTICIEADPSCSSHNNTAKDVINAVKGTYKRAGCRQTTNQSALWIKEASGGTSCYILIKPNVSRTGPDTAIVTTSISHEHSSSILAVFPGAWQPNDALDPDAYKVEKVQFTSWVPLLKMDCSIPDSNVQVNMQTDPQTSVRSVLVSGLSQDNVTQLCRRSDPKFEEHLKLDVVGGQTAQQIIRVFNIICVAPILQFAASGGLGSVKPDSPWIPISPSNSTVPFGYCKKTDPPRPTEDWFFDEERGAWERRSQPGASREYYKALQAASQPFELYVDMKKKTLTVKVFPEVAAHHAAHQIIGGRGGHELRQQVNVCWRLSDISQQSDPILQAFTVRNCDAESPTLVNLKSPYVLYERQQKVVTKMLAIEKSTTEFEELEMSAHEMPGSTGLSLVSRATRKSQISGGVICDAIGSGKTVISIAIILRGLEEARRVSSDPEWRSCQTGASLVVVPPALIDQWGSELDKFTSGLQVIKIYDNASFTDLTVQDFLDADVVICPIDILEAHGYVQRLLEAAGINVPEVPTLPTYSGQIEKTGARGVWIPATSADPYGGANNSNNQKRRNQSAYFTHVYLDAVQKLRQKDFQLEDHAPLEYFEFERVFVDEVHETLCTTKSEIDDARAKDKAGFFREKNRRAGRELLGITSKDIRKRPLIFRKGIFGLTGTPLLDSSSRVTELANLMGGAYVCGLSSHWRKLERESTRDIFLHSYLEPKQSREIRKAINSKAQAYIRIACCRNKTGEEMDGIHLVDHLCSVNMTAQEKDLYFKSQSGIQKERQSFAITPEEFDVTAGHDVKKFLCQNASLESRGQELVRICRKILSRKGDEQVKIIVFTDGKIGAGSAARGFLDESGLHCTFLESDDSVEMKNRKISWYQTGDATEKDRNRPRVLVLHFDHAAGLNLQTECHDLILFSPLYIGQGGVTGDAVSDTSTELQAIGRVYRAGQPNPEVHVWRIEIKGPGGEDCLDRHLIRRTTDKDTIAMAVNAGDE